MSANVFFDLSAASPHLKEAIAHCLPNHSRSDYPSEPIISLPGDLSPSKTLNGLNVRSDDVSRCDGQVARSCFSGALCSRTDAPPPLTFSKHCHVTQSTTRPSDTELLRDGTPQTQVTQDSRKEQSLQGVQFSQGRADRNIKMSDGVPSKVTQAQEKWLISALLLVLVLLKTQQKLTFSPNPPYIMCNIWTFRRKNVNN